jgi:glucosamine kinase
VLRQGNCTSQRPAPPGPQREYQLEKSGASGTILVSFDANKRRAPVEIRYLIGVDGGGTGTRARLATPDGAAIATGEAGPSALGQGVAQAWRHVGEAIAQAFAAADLVRPPLAECLLALGLSGAHVAQRRTDFIAAAPALGGLVLSDDGSTSLYGAFGGAAGAVVASGTGCIGEALRADGERVTVNGWGFGVGDEGSGAWLGLGAVRHAHRALDGRATPGPLADAVWAQAGRDREALLAWGEQATQASYAALAPQVFELETADPVAAGLLADALQALVQTADALDPGGMLPLVVTGSIGQRLQPRLPERLQRRLTTPQGDSADGALWLARRALQGEVRA